MPSQSTPKATHEDISGMKVDVYRNLQHGGYSVRSREKETRGLVISHEESVVVRDAEFVVQESGRQKVLEEERKNVHAFVRGKIPEREKKVYGDIPVTYNPYEYKNFVNAETEEPLDTAKLVILSEDGVLAEHPKYL